MKTKTWDAAVRAALAGAMLGVAAVDARADAILDWSARSEALVAESKLGTPPAIRVMAFVQTAAYGAVDSVTRHPAFDAIARGAERDAALSAAVAAAHRATLAKLVPSLQKSIEAAYQDALATIPEGPAKAAGIVAGDAAAVAVLARVDDAASPPPYRPHAQPGSYVPTVTPAVPQWGQRKPWLMATPAQFRPGPPPALTSDAWARDYNEVKAYGGKVGSKRSPEQTEIARFWEYSLPAIYHGVVRSVAAMPGRDVVQNARLFAAVAQAMDDAMIAVFDAKYHYNFWRPATAIRNGDVDGNDATERDPAWAALIDNPLHPEYPSAHSILAAAVATVLDAELGGRPAPLLTTSSPSASGAIRRWTGTAAFAREVAEARVYEGVHYRTSTRVGADMGRQVGELAVARFIARPGSIAEASTAASGGTGGSEAALAGAAGAPSTLSPLP